MSWKWEYAFGAEEAPGGMFRYQVVVRSQRVYVVQITCLGF
ncbi:hypothetical protein [Streptomyces galbus]|nr:hypothetical protein [Streptomyces galbus]